MAMVEQSGSEKSILEQSFQVLAGEYAQSGKELAARSFDAVVSGDAQQSETLRIQSEQVRAKVVGINRAFTTLIDNLAQLGIHENMLDPILTSLITRDQPQPVEKPTATPITPHTAATPFRAESIEAAKPKDLSQGQIKYLLVGTKANQDRTSYLSTDEMVKRLNPDLDKIQNPQERQAAFESKRGSYYAQRSSALRALKGAMSSGKPLGPGIVSLFETARQEELLTNRSNQEIVGVIARDINFERLLELSRTPEDEEALLPEFSSLEAAIFAEAMIVIDAELNTEVNLNLGVENIAALSKIIDALPTENDSQKITAAKQSILQKLAMVVSDPSIKGQLTDERSLFLYMLSEAMSPAIRERLFELAY